MFENAGIRRSRTSSTYSAARSRNPSNTAVEFPLGERGALPSAALAGAKPTSSNPRPRRCRNVFRTSTAPPPEGHARRQRKPVPVLHQDRDPPLHVVVGAAPRRVGTVDVVDLPGAVDADAHGDAVLLEEPGDLPGHERAVGGEGEGDLLPPCLGHRAGFVNRGPQEGEPEERLPAEEDDGHFPVLPGTGRAGTRRSPGATPGTSPAAPPPPPAGGSAPFLAVLVAVAAREVAGVREHQHECPEPQGGMRGPARRARILSRGPEKPRPAEISTGFPVRPALAPPRR